MKPDEIQNLDLAERHEDPEFQLIPIGTTKDVPLTEPYPTGFTSLDSAMLGGLRRGDLMIISGLSGRGKTHLTLQMVKNYTNDGQPVLLFSFEEPVNRIKWRLQNMKARTDIPCFVPKKLKTGAVEWLEQKILDGISNLMIRIVVIDNLDFLTAEKQLSTDDKWAMQGRIIAMLKRIAIEHNVIIILNAHIKKVDESEPKLEDLYGSGDVYKLADFVIFIHRIREKVSRRGDSKDAAFTEESKIIVEKNRLQGQFPRFKVKMVDNLFIEDDGWS